MPMTFIEIFRDTETHHRPIVASEETRLKTNQREVPWTEVDAWCGPERSLAETTLPDA